FHLVDQQLVIVERAISSTLLGLMLGWLSWRTGSVVPGIILHATHNGCLLLLLYFQPQLIQSGWLQSGDAALPMPCLLAGSGGVLVGLGWIWLGGARISRGEVEK